MSQLTMYIVLRKDLTKSLGWSTGSVIAQACHATTACLHQYKHLPNTQTYLDDIQNMHKVTLETKNGSSLEKLTLKLKEFAIPHLVWVEQPENIPTCIATAPIYKQELKEVLKTCSLYKA